ncbi:MAG: phage tail length tape measure family protein [Pseudomonadota bacterium]
MDVARLAVQVDTTDLKDGKADLDNFTASGKRAEDQVRKTNNTTTETAKKAGDQLKVNTFHSANLFAQWNDIGVMMASGQSPFMLALQQGSQVNQILAQMGNRQQILRALASSFSAMVNPVSLVTFGLIGGTAALGQWALSAVGASKDTKTLAEAMEDLGDGIAAYKRAALEGAELADYLAEEFGSVTAESIELAERLQQLRMAEIMIDAANATDQLTASFRGGLRSELARLVDFFDQMEYTGEQATAAAERFAQQLETIRTADGPEQQLDAVRGLADQLLEAAGSVDAMTEEQRDYYSLLLQTAQRLSLVVSLTKDVADETGNAADEAGRLAENLLDALSAKNRLDSDYDPGAQGVPGGRGRVIPDRTDGILSGFGGEFIDFDRGGRSRRGGGSDSFEDDLQRLREELRTEREVIDEWYLEGQEILADRRAQELLGIEEHNAAKLALEHEYNARVSQLQIDQAEHVKSAQQRATSAALDFLDTLAQQSKGAAIALLAVNTGLRIAEAIQNTAVAATRALAELGPILGPPAAAKIKAFGAAQVGLIAANAALRLGTYSSGSGSGGSIASGVGTTSAVAAEPTPVSRNVAIQLEGQSFTRDQVRDLINEINEAVDDGAIIRLV